MALSSRNGGAFHFQKHRKEATMCDDFYDDFDGLDWDDWMLIGPLSEEIARERREKDSIRRENDEDGDYFDVINRQ